jgi:hypothetical protein
LILLYTMDVVYEVKVDQRRMTCVHILEYAKLRRMSILWHHQTNPSKSQRLPRPSDSLNVAEDLFAGEVLVGRRRGVLEVRSIEDDPLLMQ